MSAIYHCCDPGRRELLAAPGIPFSGIDFIEVKQGTSVADFTFIEIRLVKPLPLPAAALTKDQIEISGGIRFPAPKADRVDNLPDPNASGLVATYRVRLPGNQPTDFSTYRLAIVSQPGGPPPAFLDPRLAAVDFSFKAGCPTPFDCREDGTPRPEPPPLEPVVNYAARDWRGFRRQMLDRIAALVPGFREDDPADFAVTLVEALAYRADQQSYRLDSIGTEAFLDTARAPSSLARLARLVDYRPDPGASARVPLAFSHTPGVVPDGLVLAAATPVIARRPDLPPVLAAPDYARALVRSRIAAADVFQTLAPLTCWSWRNRLRFHTWGDTECCLPKGATGCTFVDTGGGLGPLAPGDFLILCQTRSPDTGAEADADPGLRWLVRLHAAIPETDGLAPGRNLVTVRWGADDALPFDLVVSARLAGQSRAAPALVCAEARGNVTLADHGASLPPPSHLGLTASESDALRPRLDPPLPLPGLPWRPSLSGGSLARVAQPELTGPPWASARSLLTPGSVRPALRLDDDFATWDSRDDLLASGPFDRDFVVESGLDGGVRLRFGDGVHGLAPNPGSAILPSGRFGVGRAGNIGHDTLAHVALPIAQAAARLTVTNPLGAEGGSDPEGPDQIRLRAPEAYRLPDRAVTAADYAACALRHPQVANALAIPRWTGAWQTIVLYIDRKGGLPVDRPFLADLLTFLERFRLMGFDLVPRAARPAPLELSLRVCARPGELRAAVGQRVRQALLPFGPADGSPGFFHPDRFSFGTPLHLSTLVAAVMAVPGVESVTPLTFRRLGRLDQGERAAGVIRPAEAEILQCADDPSFPEQGRLELRLGGGR
ncbi:MAG: putative baseplate assembly protein [Cyanobacteriota bacterium]